MMTSDCFGQHAAQLWLAANFAQVILSGRHWGCAGGGGGGAATVVGGGAAALGAGLGEGAAEGDASAEALA